MKINKKYIFKRLFRKEYEELEEKRKSIKILNESLNAKKIEAKDLSNRVNKLIEENTILRRENGELRSLVKKTESSVIDSKEYKTLLEKYNELIYGK